MARFGRRAKLSARTSRLVLDSGAVIALSRGDFQARAYLDRALELGVEVEIPVVVVAETLRGTARDAPVHRVLKTIGKVPHATERVGRLAGHLLGEARSSSTIDALVVAQTIESGGGTILTGDPSDLEILADGRAEVRIEAL